MSERNGITGVACGDCNHQEHEAGECTHCNCGQSEIVRKNPLSGDFWFYDEFGRPHSGGRRVFEAPRAA